MLTHCLRNWRSRKSKKLREDRKKAQKIKEDFDGYNAYERDNLNRLIENTVE